jgi:hypothetical protein
VQQRRRPSGSNHAKTYLVASGHSVKAVAQTTCLPVWKPCSPSLSPPPPKTRKKPTYLRLIAAFRHEKALYLCDR